MVLKLQKKRNWNKQELSFISDDSLHHLQQTFWFNTLCHVADAILYLLS